MTRDLSFVSRVGGGATHATAVHEGSRTLLHIIWTGCQIGELHTHASHQGAETQPQRTVAETVAMHDTVEIHELTSISSDKYGCVLFQIVAKYNFASEDCARRGVRSTSWAGALRDSDGAERASSAASTLLITLNSP